MGTMISMALSDAPQERSNQGHSDGGMENYVDNWNGGEWRRERVGIERDRESKREDKGESGKRTKVRCGWRKRDHGHHVSASVTLLFDIIEIFLFLSSFYFLDYSISISWFSLNCIIYWNSICLWKNFPLLLHYGHVCCMLCNVML
jgi:hypothetical protein